VITISPGAGGVGGTTYRASTGPATNGSSSIFGGGPELVTNGTFPNTTSGWTTAGGTLTTVTRGNRFTALYMHSSLPEVADPDFHPGNNEWKAKDYPLVNL
jgi:hypothetical protein